MAIKSVGEKLYECRKKAGSSLKESASFGGIHPATLSSYEKDKTEIKIHTLKRLCDFYKCDFNYFFEDTEK